MQVRIITLFFFFSICLSISAQVESSLSGGAEPCITKNSTNPNQIAVAFIKNSSVTDFLIYYSNDGGTTWNLSAFDAQALYLSLYGTSPGPSGGGDPILSFDNSGVLHFTYIINGKMLYVTSTDGGATFNPPSITGHEVDNNVNLDRQWMTSDYSGGVNDGNIYLCATSFNLPFGTGMDTIVLYTKPKDSLAFNAEKTPIFSCSAGEFLLFSNISVDQSGQIHSSCMRFNVSNLSGSYLYSKSTDGGQTFSSPLTLGMGTTSLNGQNNIIHFKDNAAVSLAVDGSNVYVCWSDYSNNSVKSYYTYSNNGGSSFSTPIEFGSITTPGPYFHLMPNVAGDNGNMSISWYVADSLTLQTSYYVAFSSDSGSTFNSTQVVSGGTTNFNDPIINNEFYGDYNSSIMVGCESHAVWTDGRTQSPIVYHFKVDHCSVGLIEQNPVSDQIKVGSVYPNPSNEYIRVEVSTSKTDLVSWKILNFNGKTIRQGKDNNSPSTFELNIKDLPIGQYLLLLQFKNNMSVTRNFSKQ